SRPCPRVGVPGGSTRPQPRERPIRLHRRDRPVDRMGPAPPPVHAFDPRPAAGHAVPIRRVWEWTSFAIVIATLMIWVFYSTKILTLPPEYGYVGVILITAFTYTLL